MHLIFVLILAGIAIFGIVGNSLVLLVVCYYKRMRTPTYMFVANLAIADLLVVCYVMPIGLVASQAGPQAIPILLCQLTGFLVTECLVVSTSSLMAISLERYLHICWPILHNKFVTTKSVALAIAFTWVFTTSLAVVAFFVAEVDYQPYLYVCALVAYSNPVYSLVVMVTGIVIPFFAIIFCYCMIIRTVRASTCRVSPQNIITIAVTTPTSTATSAALSQSHPANAGGVTAGHSRRSAREKRLTVMLMVLVSVFALFWCPESILLGLSYDIHTLMAIPWRVFTAAFWFALCNSSVNSMVYGITNKEFRTAYTLIARRVLDHFSSDTPTG